MDYVDYLLIVILISVVIAGFIEYLRPVRPNEKAYDKAMNEYWKACRATVWVDLKQSWAELRGRKTTP